MDLNYDYGDVVHKHKHIHTKPDSHKQVVEHSLREWCHDYFGDTGAPECSELNDIQDHDIDDGIHDNVKVSDFFKMIKDLEKLNGEYEVGGAPVNIKFNIVSIDGEDTIIIEKKDDDFEITSGDYVIKEDGIYNGDIELEKKDGKYDGTVVKNLKQFLRNIDQTKLKEEIDTSKNQLELKTKELKKILHKQKNKFGAERKLQQLEKLEEERLLELIILIGFFIIAFIFGVYCIFTQFNLKL
tara:strand:- start:2163 stop:2885 length:723 start_codon:yes stop_codon:yes gene_type:complete